MKINLCFKNFILGTLSYENNNYIFVQNDKDIVEFKKVYPFELFDFQEKTSSSPTLFPMFQEIVENIKKRNDLMQKANIEKQDSDFVILFKYAKLQQYPNTFFLSRVNND